MNCGDCKSVKLGSITDRLMGELAVHTARPLPVLIVEDDPNDAEIMQRTLEDRGCECTISRRGDAAVKLISENPNRFRIAFVDLNLPGSDGREVLKAIKEFSRETHVIIVTGTDRITEIPMSVYYGVVQKPLLPEVASEILEKTSTPKPVQV